MKIFEFDKEILKIPLTGCSDHGWSFGSNPEAFYITIDETNAIYKKQSSDDDSTE